MQSSSTPRVELGRPKKLAFACISLILTLLTLECAARGVEFLRPSTSIDYSRGFDAALRVFVPAPGGSNQVTTAPGKDAFFRVQTFGSTKPPDTLRIALLGGSSVYLFDSEIRNMEATLESAVAPKYRRVEVINGGGLSYGSGRMVAVALEMLSYDPDVLILYEANNEFTEMEQFRLAQIDSKSVEHALSWSALVRVLRDAVNARLVARIQDDIVQQSKRTGSTPPISATGEIDMYAVTPLEVGQRMASFRSNYGLMIDLCRSHHTRVIIGAEPSNLVQPFLPRAQELEYQTAWDLMHVGRFADADVVARRILAEPWCRHQASDVENQILRDLAAERRVTLADVESAVRAAEPHGIPGETLFRDHCHLNYRGNVILRETLCRAVLECLANDDR